MVEFSFFDDTKFYAITKPKRKRSIKTTKLCDFEKQVTLSHDRFEYKLAKTKLKHAVFVRPS